MFSSVLKASPGSQCEGVCPWALDFDAPRGHVCAHWYGYRSTAMLCSRMRVCVHRFTCVLGPVDLCVDARLSTMCICSLVHLAHAPPSSRFTF